MRRLSRGSSMKTSPEVPQQGLFVSGLSKLLPDGRVLFEDIELHLKSNPPKDHDHDHDYDNDKKESETEAEVETEVIGIEVEGSEDVKDVKENHTINYNNNGKVQVKSSLSGGKSYSSYGTSKQGTIKITHNGSINGHKGEDRKDVITVRGASGCGKTTLLRCIAQLESCEGGATFCLNGQTPEEMGIPIWRSKVLYVPQRTPNLSGTPMDFWKTIRRFHAQRNRDEISYDPIDIASHWNLSEETWYKDWTQLSGGEMQRAMLAIAISRNPEVLLLDEPTSALDHDTTLAVEKTLKKMNCIWITHSNEQEKRVATQTITLSKSSSFSAVAINQS